MGYAMKILSLLKLALISLLIIAAPLSYAVTIDKIIVFGDSLSDNGNLYNFTKKLNSITSYVPVLPKDPPYFKGRFSNGPVWIEYVAQVLNVPLVDYAYGGAWAENYSSSGQIVPFGLGTQVDLFLTASVNDANTGNYLYVIWAGGNDYLHGNDEIDHATTNTIETIRSQIEWLTYYGAKNFLIVNMPDLGTTPEAAESGIAGIARARALSEMHNRKLVDMIAAEKTKYPDVKFISFDITKFYGEVIAHPENYHIKNLTSACYGGGYTVRALAMNRNNAELQAAQKAHINIENNPSLMAAYSTAKLAEAGQMPCANPDDYFYWDHVHPSRVIHQAFSNAVVSALRENGVG